MAHLEVRYRDSARSGVFELKDDVITVGRSLSNRLVLSDKSVSRQHCVIERDNGVLRVRDVGSRNGIRVNRHARQDTTLSPGDEIGVGRVRLTYFDHDPPLIETVPVDRSAETIHATEIDAPAEGLAASGEPPPPVSQTVDRTLTELTGQVQQLESQRDRVADKLNVAERELASSKQASRDLEARTDAARQEAEQAAAEMIELQERCLQLEQEVTAADRQHHDLAEQIEMLRGELAAAERQRHDDATSTAQLGERLELLAERESSLTGQLEQATARRTELEHALAQSEAEHEDWSKQIRQLEEQLAAAAASDHREADEAATNALKQRVDELEDELRILRASAETFQADRGLLESRLEEAQANLQHGDRRVRELREQLENAADEQRRAAFEHANDADEIERLGRELRQLTAAGAESTNEADERQQQLGRCLQEADAQRESLEQQLLETQERLEMAFADHRKAAAERAGDAAIIDELEQELATLAAREAALQASVRGADAERAKLSERLSLQDVESKELRGELQFLRDALKETRASAQEPQQRSERTTATTQPPLGEAVGEMLPIAAPLLPTGLRLDWTATDQADHQRRQNSRAVVHQIFSGAPSQPADRDYGKWVVIAILVTACAVVAIALFR